MMKLILALLFAVVVSGEENICQEEHGALMSCYETDFEDVKTFAVANCNEASAECKASMTSAAALSELHCDNPKTDFSCFQNEAAPCFEELTAVITCFQNIHGEEISEEDSDYN